MSWLNVVDRWKNFPHLDENLRQQLNEMNEKALEDAFYKSLEFGTGGMRGEIGVGTNRMNIYTVRKAAFGLGSYLKSFGEEGMRRGVVISYDSRHQSFEFAKEAAKTLATLGIKAYIFNELRPTPELSFAVRYLHAYAGIMITASHNPKEYNGFKVYGPDGGQLTSEAAERVIRYIDEIDNELYIEVLNETELEKKGLIEYIGEKIDEAYIEKVIQISENDERQLEKIKIVFTPLHGATYLPVKKVFSRLTYGELHIVKEQAMPDPNFSTVKFPNPEEKSAFELAIKKGKEIGADILIATDPDGDRLGVAVKDEKGDYFLLTGNQTGALFLHYLLLEKKKKNNLPKNGVLLKTIVTSELGKEIAASFGVETEDVLIGFKYIGEKIKDYEKDQSRTFLFGYEESYGYLIGDFTRDKDAIQAAVLATEVCAYYKKQKMSLYDGLHSLYEQYGYFKESQISVTLKGKEGREEMERLMNSFRNHPLKQLGGLKVIKQEDYLTSLATFSDGVTQPLQLPKSNIMKYFFEDGSWICARPSGTEPKIKYYFGVKGKSLADSEMKLKTLMEAWQHQLNYFS